jgi:hypothetical protein
MISSSQTLVRQLPDLDTASGPTGPLARVRETFAALACAVRGHEPQLRASAARLWLHCPACDRSTHGWELDSPRPRLRFQGDPGRFRSYAWVTASEPVERTTAA